MSSEPTTEEEAIAGVTATNEAQQPMPWDPQYQFPPMLVNGPVPIAISVNRDLGAVSIIWNTYINDDEVVAENFIPWITPVAGTPPPDACTADNYRNTPQASKIDYDVAVHPGTGVQRLKYYPGGEPIIRSLFNGQPADGFELPFSG